MSFRRELLININIAEYRETIYELYCETGEYLRFSAQPTVTSKSYRRYFQPVTELLPSTRMFASYKSANE